MMRTYCGAAVILAAQALSGAVIAGPDLAPAGAVYTMSNEASGNRILVFQRSTGGMLTPSASVETGGIGSGGGLGNQGGVVLSRDLNWLLAVNAGSDEISLFSLRSRRPTLTWRAFSGGRRPVSLAIHGKLVYVLNAGGSVGDQDNIAGFRIGARGRLLPIEDSTRPLSQAVSDPAQISFAGDGKVLVVTEKATDRIVTYALDQDARPGDPMVHPSAGVTPFGFAVDRRGRIIVSEAFGGAPDASALSSYEVDDDGGLSLLDASVPTTETAACWVVTSADGRFAYTTNTGSGTISGYSVDDDGSLELLDADGVTASTGGGSGPIDLALSVDGRFLFDLRSGTGEIGVFRVRPDGALDPIGSVGGLPAGSNGLAAR